MDRDIFLNRNDMADLLAGRHLLTGRATLARDNFTDDQLLNLVRGERVEVEIDGTVYGVRTSY